MIILYHNRIYALKYENTHTNEVITCSEVNIQKCLYSLASKFKNTVIVWSHISLENSINKEKINDIFHHQLIFSSYSINGEYIIPKEIGFVDQNCFVNVKRDITYPTWLMSSDVGGANTNIILKSQILINIKQSFDEFLCSLAKLYIPKGLLCYSEPNLLKDIPDNICLRVDKDPLILYNFVKRHYKVTWIFILLLNQIIYNKELLLRAFLRNLFVKRQIAPSINFDDINIQTTRKKIEESFFKVDVLIPTLGRKKHLYNVLKDLSEQTLLPHKVIIVEQSGNVDDISELNYLNNNWPFIIDHTFIHQLGACNARNIALSKVTGTWVFFADDDIRFESDLLKRSLNEINKFGTDSIVLSCLLNGETIKNTTITQSSHFGSGTSIVKSEVLNNVFFKKEHEFGYGEDNDFGMQLRNKGIEILNLPKISMLHLKAPIGGFRFKMIQEWSKDKIQPKPSPTVMAYNLKHLTIEQLKGYKTLLILKFYNRQSIINPLSYIKSFNKRWNTSVNWATKLIEDEL